MGTQTNVKFSRIAMPISAALHALRESAFDPLQIQLRKFSRIQPTGEPAFPGYDTVGRPSNLTQESQVLDELGPGDSFAVGYLAGVPAYIYLNFFDFQDDSYSLLLNFDSSLLYYSDDNNAKGEVLARILSNIVKTLDIDVCGYNSGNRYLGEWDSLSVEEIIAGVRSGELLKRNTPFYYAVKSTLLTVQEARSAASGTAAKYKLFGQHHILRAWPD